MKYEDMSRKQKQLLALEYPYKSNAQLFNLFSKNEERIAFDNKGQLEEAKRKMLDENGVHLMNRSEFVTGDKIMTKSDTISILDSAFSPFGENVYRDALEMSEREMDPKKIIKELVIIQARRLELGMRYEQEVGMGNNPETEACVRGLESIVKTYNDIVNGKKHDVTVRSLSSMIAEMDIDDEELVDEMYDTGEELYDYPEN